MFQFPLCGEEVAIGKQYTSGNETQTSLTLWSKICDVFKEAPCQMCPSLPTGNICTCTCSLKTKMKRRLMSHSLLCFTGCLSFTLLYSVFILCALPCCFSACMLASVLIGLSDEMLLRAVVIAQCPNWHHSLSTSSPWREFDPSGVTTMCYHPAQSVI